jgi:hypothetical protein
MRQRWRLAIPLLVVGLIGVAIAIRYRQPEQQPGVRPFTDLDTAVAPDAAHGWKLAVSPRYPGPYRLQGAAASSGIGHGLTGRVCDANGAVLEELKLEPIQETDQSIVYLETRSGRLTMAALKRAR